MWSGGISKRNPVRPAGKWAQGLTCQTAKTPACHITNCCKAFFIYFQFQVNSVLVKMHRINFLSISLS
jgi:hypothetical protein